MSKSDRVILNKISTGVAGLDQILGGGLPEFSFNIIAGEPGCGKTTMAHQIAFANASEEHPVLYFTILGEPALKMLRYQQQFEFFDPTKVGAAIRFINLSQFVLEKDLSAALDEIVKTVEESSPGVVIVDSFRTMVRKMQSDTGELEIQSLVQRLALHLTSWEATTFLIGEYSEAEMRNNPVFTVADGLVWLSQSVERNSVLRKLKVVKCRGRAPMPGLHIFRITDGGLQAFPRTLALAEKKVRVEAGRRLTTGIEELDKMMGGGIPEGDSVMVAGESGTGKTVLASQFIAAGVKNGEPGVLVIFEERPVAYAERAAQIGLDLTTPQGANHLRVIYLRPLDLTVDETLHEVIKAVAEIGAKRVVIDSLAGFERALAPDFRQDFQEALYRMIGTLTGIGVTIMSTLMLEVTSARGPISDYAISFLSDDIIRLRYVEIEGQLRKILTVVKMRGGGHSNDIREYQINSEGMKILEQKLNNYRGLMGGNPERLPSPEA